MIVITHKDNKVLSIFDYDTKNVIEANYTDPIHALFQMANNYPNKLIAWCHDDLKDFINDKGFQHVFHHKRIMASFEIRNHNYISDRIGYVESSPFINLKKEVTYPTWLMSGCIGGIHAEVLLKFDIKDFKDETLDYALNSMAKNGMLTGLFCYSAKELLLSNDIKLISNKSSTKTLYKFIKQHYKVRWTFIVFFNNLIYEKKLQIIPLLYSWFVSKKKTQLNCETIEVKSSRSIYKVPTIDVVIPTIGRKQYLYAVLKDLSKQTLLPKQVIIVEQNPELNSKSELDYLTTDTWPFKINHVFTHKSGACNARNLALNKVEADMVFLADDDIRFETYILEKALMDMHTYGLKACTLSCLKKGETEAIRHIMPWHTFGTASSIISSSLVNYINFDEGFEHGFGEDGDFGMQIRNLGEDIGYLPHCKLLHLKAPSGGFRTVFLQPWEKEILLPKPSPTIMLFNLKHYSKYQIRSYKTTLFYKFYKLQSNRNIMSYYFDMKKRWNKSVFWAKQLQLISK